MRNFDIIGFKLEDGIRIIRKASNLDIKSIETVGFSKNNLKEVDNLNDARILRVLEVNDTITVVYGYF